MVRDATPGDFEAVMRLLGQLHADDPVVDDATSREAFVQILRTPNLHLLVLDRNVSVVASAYLNVIPNLTRSMSPYAVIENVVVDESRRGSGLGKTLIAGTLDRAWSAGCYKAMLMTGSRRSSTHGFYRACGFSADEKTAYVARPDRRAP